jgi:hypothetical protein
MPREAEVTRGTPETQIVVYPQGNSTRMILAVSTASELRNLDTLPYKIKRKWGKKSEERRIGFVGNIRRVPGG